MVNVSGQTEESGMAENKKNSLRSRTSSICYPSPSKSKIPLDDGTTGPGESIKNVKNVREEENGNMALLMSFEG
jgi:hypothetical protein